VKNRLWAWNAELPTAVKRCIHEMIGEQAQVQPDAPAVHAWDGQLTYGELDRLSTRLAHQLVDEGVVPGTVVPLCFEKSMWTTVAMLAVLKTGAAFCMLELAYPETRLQAILHQTKATIVLSSVPQLDFSSRLAKKAIPVGSGLVPDSESTNDARTLPSSDPSSLMYIAFTSGSTGVPKGVLTSHMSFCSTIKHQASRLGFSPSSRTLDFSPHAFDLVIHNTCVTLATGGCVCVPSEADRKNNQTSCIRSMQATYALITPTVARLIQPDEVQSLETLALIGEPLTEADMQRWWDRTRIVNTYGVTECNTMVLINLYAQDPLTATRIGKGAGVVTWVVDLIDYNKLAPIGVIGELLLEGPLLGESYLNDPKKTAALFIEDPVWLVQGTPTHPGRRGRLYRTGDLVRYNEDGTLSFISRRDTQVKIRGQRLELGDVEHHMRECMPQSTCIAAEVITPIGEATRSMLAVFVSSSEVDENAIRVLTIPADIENELSQRLPSFMIPTVCFLLSTLPMTVTGKINRRQLREIGSSYSLQQLADLRSEIRGSKRMPSTDIECKLQQLWARILNLDLPSIGVEDSFFQLGGDSVAAMRLVAEARRDKIQLSVADIFRQPRLAALAQSALAQSIGTDHEIPPFSLMGNTPGILDNLSSVAGSLGVDAQSIEDAYPCSPLQEGLLALTTKRPGDYILQFVSKLPPDVNLDRFRAAWERTLQLCPILRTRIIDHDTHGLFQVVIQENIYWQEAECLKDYLKGDQETGMGLGQPLARYCIIDNPTSSQGWFIWTIHHALYDGTSLLLILDLVSTIYKGLEPKKHLDYKHFIQHLLEKSDGATEFWRSEFGDCQSLPFPSLPPSVPEPTTDSRLEQYCSLKSITTPDITIASVIQAAWAMVAQSRTGTSDVVFGITVSGRNIPVVGIEAIIGPAIATVPMRIRTQLQQKVSEYLQGIQNQIMNLIPYQQTGLQQIARVSKEAEQACKFQTLLIIQVVDKEDLNKDSIFRDWPDTTSTPAFGSYALVLNCFLNQEGVNIVADYDSNVLDHQMMQRVVDQFSLLMRGLANATFDQRVGELDVLAEEEQKKLWHWNSSVPTAVECCLHQLIEQQVQSRWDTPAIHAWDGKLTYGELDKLSTRLAYKLVDQGVAPGNIIPLCFEKSMWTAVAILAVLKAGAAFCMLDPAYPENRLRIIVQQTDAMIVLSSISQFALGSRLVAKAISVGPGLIPDLDIDGAQTLPVPDPSSLMYVAFTSGSTGAPKGALVSHLAFCSGIHHQARRLGFKPTSRVLDLFAHAFDMFIHNTCVTLATGGCICVPSETDRRNNQADCIRSMRPTYALITPSIAQLIMPDELQSIDTLAVIGEPLALADSQRWWDYIHIVNTYGPAECTPITLMNIHAQDPLTATYIGKGAGVITWVVDPINYNRLTPLGVVGELLLEGPLLGDGYLNEPEKTAAVFIENPKWLLQGTASHPGRHGRLYKTGDLVKYHEDGSLAYVGRKDTQVKIRGQRVELGEVEYHLRRCMPQYTRLAAEVIVPTGKVASPTLAVFLPGDNADESIISVSTICTEMEDKLSQHLPDHMIPTVWFTLPRLPMTATDKVDRKRLREIGSSYSVQQLADLRTQPQSEKRMPSTDIECKLQEIWAQILNLDPASIGIDDSFFQLGGDSIAAMKLVARGRKVNLNLSIADIFRQPQLSALALLVPGQPASIDREVLPFSLIGNKACVLADLSDSFARHKLDPQLIEDVYPCTPLQEGLLASSTKRSGDYILRSVLRLSPDVDLDCFRAAWERTVELCPILRTRITYHHNHGFLQIVVRDKIQWLKAENLEDRCEEDYNITIGLDQPLARYCLIYDPTTLQTSFTWTIHHAIYDRASLSLILNSMAGIYQGLQPNKYAEYKHFVRHLLEVNNDAAEAEAFWRLQFKNSQCIPFPPLSLSVQEPLADSRVERFCALRTISTPDITIATVVRAAWAMVAYSRTDGSDVIFGTTVSGRNAPIAGIEAIVGPTITTVPTRVCIQPWQTVSQYLQGIQKQMADLIPYEQTGLQRIAKVSSEAELACKFQTLLAVHPADEYSKIESMFGNWEDNIQEQAFGSYALVLNCFLDRKGVRLVVDYDSRILDQWMMKLVLDQFDLLIQELGGVAPDQQIGKLNVLAEKELDVLWKWNATVPTAVDRCIHDLIHEQVQEQPDALAIQAWDGQLTYNELDKLSTWLAYELVDQGVVPGTIVPLCFEKSMWTTVAVLAVLKAGAAFCMLDLAHPENRLHTIVLQTKATIVLSSVSQLELSSHLAAKAIPVGGSGLTVAMDGTNNARILPRSDPLSAMYLVFTSGSTGVPKGSLISHAAFCSNIHYQALRLGFNPASRVLDIAAHAFDMFVHITGVTLATGGCLCVLSESERKDTLIESIARAKPTLITATPSFSRLIQPEMIPSIETIILGGECLTLQDAERWGKYATIINVYGPSECTPVSIFNRGTEDLSTTTRIGKGAGVITWIVDPINHNQLTPLGAVGELLLEGPLLGEGYLSDTEKTAATFIQDPTWLLQGTARHPGRHGRLYKTGDLVRYHEDGSLGYIGRKDTQVKIRGQRVELDEVEYRVRECMPQAAQYKQLAAEVIKPAGEATNPVLVVFLSNNKADEGSITEAGNIAVLAVPVDVEDKLVRCLPSYMLPTIYFILPCLPMTTTDKVDRRRLRELGDSYSIQQLADLRSQTQGEKRMPDTDIEHRLQRLWAQVLNINLASISVDSSFFQLGGDSITAMKLVAEARKIDLQLSVADVFRQPRLSLLAQGIVLQPESIDCAVPPFSLVGDLPSFLEDLGGNGLVGSGLDMKLIEDLYPCSSLQEGLLALTTKKSGEYILQFGLQLSPSIDVDRFCAAWEQTVRLCSILRTRIINHGTHGLFQVVTKENIHWEAAENLKDYLQKDQEAMGLGQPLAQYALIHDPTGSRSWFVWTIHHALYDGTSLPLILDLVSSIYQGIEPKKCLDYKYFIQHLLSRDNNMAEIFWRSEFMGYQYNPFPSLPLSIQEPIADSRLKRHCLLKSITTQDITFATVIQAAWALVAQNRTGTSDIVFGALVSGRNAPISGIETIIGPTIATVPIRVRTQLQQTVAEYLQKIQSQMTNLIPYQQTGLQQIAKVSKEAEQACKFQTLLVIQPVEVDSKKESIFGEWQDMTRSYAFDSYALTINCFLEQENVKIVVDYDSRVIDHWTMQTTIDQFCYLTQELATATSDQQIGDIDMLAVEERRMLWGWNSNIPASVERCVHELVEEQVQTQPDAPAIHAWDGHLTYSELDRLATKLAYYLIRLGVGSGTIVPLCFEKSMWTAVAMLAVLKAGAAFCMLDLAYPEIRLRTIAKQTKATIILSSTSQLELSSRLVANAILVGPGLNSNHDGMDRPYTPLPLPDPSSLMYVAFTSGSTGVPKGALVSHTAFSSGISHQAHHLGFKSSSRVLDLFAHAFDVFIHNTIVTLAMGGCICIPSEMDRRNNQGSCIRSMRASYALLTPTIARLIPSDELQLLDTLALIGEPSTLADMQEWWNCTHTINTYGPAECTPITLINIHAQDPLSATYIGNGTGIITWIVDPINHNKLVPIGAIGELLLEGPLLGDGYLNEPEKTAAAFIENPKWLLQGTVSHPGRYGRLYKTGDLVRYNKDGSLSYIGRKDRQVKIHGQRLELGEVEHHISKCMAYAAHLAVEVITPAGEAANPVLAVFLSTGKHDESGLTGESSIRAMAVPADVEDEISQRLPSYMIPRVCFVLSRLPTTATDKVDRKRLREIGSSYSTQQLADLRSQARGEKRMPSTNIENILQQLWAQVLNIDPASIGVDDSFFDLGGDSVAAMKLVAEARKTKLQLSVPDIFRQPTVAFLAALAASNEYLPCSSDLSRPFGLVRPEVSRRIMAYLRESAPFVDPSNIEDILPTTAFQQLYLRLFMQRPTVALNYCSLHLGAHVDISQLRDACSQLINRFPILRTIFVPETSLQEQIVLRKLNLPLQIIQVDGDMEAAADSVFHHDKIQKPPPGSPFLSFFLLCHRTLGHRLTIRISHAQYDGVSLPLIVQALLDIYHRRPSEVYPPFSDYLAHVQNQRSQSVMYWRRILRGSHVTSLSQALCADRLVDSTPALVHAECSILTPELPQNLTLATLVSSAWALVLSSITNEKDLVYGQVVAGRNAQILGISEIIGPCANIVPVRVEVQHQQSVLEYLKTVQKQYLSLEQSDSMGLDDIIKECTDWPSRTGFDSVIQHIGSDRIPNFRIDDEYSQLHWLQHDYVGLSYVKVESAIENNRLGLQIYGDSNVLNSRTAQALVSSLRAAVIFLSTNTEIQIKEMPTTRIKAGL
jgi:amino acid adenylation domain-containing protein